MLNPSQNQSFIIDGNLALMDKLHNNVNSLGLSIEMLFRGTDLDCNGSVTLENFKITLTKIRLSLSPSEVNKIAYIFDEECTGVIYKKSFMQTLITYGVNEEPIDADWWNIGQKCLIDFCKMLHDKVIEPEVAWMSMDIRKQGYITADMLSAYFKVFFKYFYYLDTQSLSHKKVEGRIVFLHGYR